MGGGGQEEGYKEHKNINISYLKFGSGIACIKPTCTHIGTLNSKSKIYYITWIFHAELIATVQWLLTMMGIVGTPYDLATTGIVMIIGTSYQCVLVIKECQAISVYF